MTAQIEIREANLAVSSDGAAVLNIIDSFANDPISGDKTLPEDVRSSLIPALQNHPTTIILLAFEGTAAVGIAICFLGFSTFQAKPLLNIHDLAVLPEFRGKGVGRALLEAVEVAAIKRDCCKVTLEVIDSNARAIELYGRLGYTNPSAVDSTSTLFLAKSISPTPAGS